MNATAMLVVSLVSAAVVLAAVSRPVRRKVGGFLVVDKRTGRVQLTLWPGSGPKRRRRGQ